MISVDETEAQFQRRVCDLAELYGWDWMHIEPMGSPKGWRTPTKGPLRQWPDLTLVRAGRIVFLELKAQKAPPPSDAQRNVIRTLSQATEAYVVRPSDWAFILEVLA